MKDVTGVVLFTLGNSNLQKQELLRKRLTSDMAHELRTPLANLKSHIEALLDKVWETTEKILTSFYEEIERLIKLVEGLNNIAKLEQTNLDLTYHWNLKK
ncbi:hypothetical protein K9O30_07230 [Clostridium bowmanii]|uniref:histidine kinase dimerization/phospho-acceptor domain-containing protein n=1 Tax=Clostridium bowmanii TaxID=132925 RepID=UPI001CD6DFB9|nr:histidine kinase dimerization/phospho-acceptor domain-containing protein [Clostridium bowmanii]MCA1073527.1 hypothetical protein [Clostridium bowmanii]